MVKIRLVTSSFPSWVISSRLVSSCLRYTGSIPYSAILFYPNLSNFRISLSGPIPHFIRSRYIRSVPFHFIAFNFNQSNPNQFHTNPTSVSL